MHPSCNDSQPDGDHESPGDDENHNAGHDRLTSRTEFIMDYEQDQTYGEYPEEGAVATGIGPTSLQRGGGVFQECKVGAFANEKELGAPHRCPG